MHVGILTFYRSPESGHIPRTFYSRGVCADATMSTSCLPCGRLVKETDNLQLYHDYIKFIVYCRYDYEESGSIATALNRDLKFSKFDGTKHSHTRPVLINMAGALKLFKNNLYFAAIQIAKKNKAKRKVVYEPWHK